MFPESLVVHKPNRVRAHAHFPKSFGSQIPLFSLVPYAKLKFYKLNFVLIIAVYNFSLNAFFGCCKSPISPIGKPASSECQGTCV